jgi:hypothetical protein
MVADSQPSVVIRQSLSVVVSGRITFGLTRSDRELWRCKNRTNPVAPYGHDSDSKSAEGGHSINDQLTS